MRRASITDIKNKLSEYISYVKRGETVRVYDRSTPVADIIPIASLEKRDLDNRLTDLELRGVIKRGHKSLSDSFFSELDRQSRTKPTRGIVDQLLRDRKAGT